MLNSFMSNLTQLCSSRKPADAESSNQSNPHQKNILSKPRPCMNQGPGCSLLASFTLYQLKPHLGFHSTPSASTPRHPNQDSRHAFCHHPHEFISVTDMEFYPGSDNVVAFTRPLFPSLLFPGT